MIIFVRRTKITVLSSRASRAADGAAKSGRRPTGLYGRFPSGPVKTKEKTRHPISKNWRLKPPQLLEIELCALPTWWFWRGGCTRSHSEHGRETPQRRWYFVSRHGRVGRCQVCKTQSPIISKNTIHSGIKTGNKTGRPQSGPLSF